LHDALIPKRFLNAVFQRLAIPWGDERMAKGNLSRKIGEMVRELEAREKEQDAILASVRGIVRHCANGIKLLHAGETGKARAEIALAKKEILPFSKTSKFEYLLQQPYQEIAEASMLLAAVEKKGLPSWEELGMPFEPYLLGLCDLIGELRREMLEMLKKTLKVLLSKIRNKITKPYW